MTLEAARSAAPVPPPATPTRLYGAYFFDLDGTVCLGDALLPGAADTIARLRALGRRTVFLSNNTTSTGPEYAEQLTRLGVPTPAGDVVNSSMALVEFLQARMAGARLLVLGEAPLERDLCAAGFSTTADAADADAVIASFDRAFTYRKLQAAFDAIRRGARFFATNADRYRPMPGGGQPDAAAIIAAIEACTGVRCETIVGKPSPHMATCVLRLVEVPAEDCVMTGDRLETDVRMALDAGMAAALTLTGATSAAVATGSAIRPTYLLRSLDELLPAQYRSGRASG